jgi:hypothetical protein
MKTRFLRMAAFIALLVIVTCSEASAEESEFDSAEAYRQIIRSKSRADVVAAIESLSEHYQKDLAAGEISSESDHELLLEAIPIIIDHMDDRDKELAINVFNVLASLQTDCPAPRKAYWQDWWKRKQAGERINWTIPVNPGTQKQTGPNSAAQTTASPSSGL